MNKFITTAIDYPNALPHIGTAFEKIGADVYARFSRLKGDNVYFSMGNDENTAKVVKAANGQGWGSSRDLYQNYVNNMASQFKSVWDQLSISYDDFIQTSEYRHQVGVQLFLQTVHVAGYIEKRHYTGFYCEGCEEFKTNVTTKDVCPNHPHLHFVKREEENYFFLFSKFKEKILKFIEESSLNLDLNETELLNFVHSDLSDVSISRRNENWGIEIPWDISQVTYVWFDALLNYLTVVGFGTDWEKFDKYWPADIHFIGKDITRFHAALFPAMIMAYNEGSVKVGRREIKLPKRIFSHGFVYQKKGQEVAKVSKSDINAIKPLDLINQFGSDAYRYYFLSKFNYDTDGVYSLDHFKEVYNSDLANDLGNLVSRTVSMTLQYFNGEIPPGKVISNVSYEMTPQVWLSEKDLNDYEELILKSCSFRHSIEIIWSIIRHSNKFIDEFKPWHLFKQDAQSLLRQVLIELIASLRIISILLQPFLPNIAEKIYKSFVWQESWEDINWDFVTQLSKSNFLNLEMGICVNRDCLAEGKFLPLFPRIKSEG